MGRGELTWVPSAVTSTKGEGQLVRVGAKNLSVPFARRASDGTYETSAEDETGRRVVVPWAKSRNVVGRYERSWTRAPYRAS